MTIGIDIGGSTTKIVGINGRKDPGAAHSGSQ
jgi:hypothetical protein